MPSQLAFLLSCRSAFVVFTQEGIDGVALQFPECVDFVLEHKAMTLKKVTSLLAAKIDAVYRKKS